MKAIVIVPIVLVVLAFRLWLFRRRRVRKSGQSSGTPQRSRPMRVGPFQSDVALVASREVRERVRGRLFRVGTILILLVVCAAIVIPTVDHGSPSTTVVGVNGPATVALKADIKAAYVSTGNDMKFVNETNIASIHRDLRSGRIDLAIVDAKSIVVDQAISPTDSSDTAQLAQALAGNLGVTEAFAHAGITSTQAAELQASKPVPIFSLRPAKSKGNVNLGISLIGLILTFVMLQQYNTWILIGVMEEKSSRVIEVLLSAVRPIRLLAGKVLGIGLVALAQATLMVGVALIVAEAVGSNVLKHSGPVVVGSSLLWLVLGYAFYCWVYAAAGSMAERQDQIQSLAFPLSLPVVAGYIISLTTLESGNATLLLKVLAYLPPTAPFAMPALVGLHAVSWWQFLASTGLSIVATVLVARFAARIYRRAILRTGRRVRIKDLAVRTAS